MLRLMVEGRPLWVRTEKVVAFGSGWQEVPNPNFREDVLVDETNPANIKRIVTMVTVEGLGTVPVDQEVSVVAAMIGVNINEPSDYSLGYADAADHEQV